MVPSSTDPVALADATALGLSAISQLLAQTEDGVTVVDADSRWVYANPAACLILNRPLVQLRGRQVRSGDASGGHPLVMSDLSDRSAPSPTTFTGRLMSPDAIEHEIVFLTCAVDIAGSLYSVAIFRDVAGPHAAARTAMAMAQTAAQLVSNAPTSDVLNGIARQAVEHTRARAASIFVIGDGHVLTVRGGYGSARSEREGGAAQPVLLSASAGEALVAQMTAGSIVVGGLPGKAVVLPDARSDWEANPALRPVALAVLDDSWRGAIFVPLAWESKVIGVLGVYLPAGIDGPDELELAFCTALADQAAVTIANARLTAHARYAAALGERTRLARDLHDSVSQALFSMTMHARAAELTMNKAGLDLATPLGRSIAQLGEIARGALAEMRALIFELRPEALTEEGLVGALRKTGAALAAREHLSITVEGPDRPLGLPASVQEDLYRIASEALSNVVGHGELTRAAVLVKVEGERIELTVQDDGVGTGAQVRQPERPGIPSMAQRMDRIGADLHITSGPGTTVTVTLPAKGPSRVRRD
jgi:signal transduction histidine kinase